jgi:hypothetical protein
MAKRGAASCARDLDWTTCGSLVPRRTSQSNNAKFTFISFPISIMGNTISGSATPSSTGQTSPASHESAFVQVPRPFKWTTAEGDEYSVRYRIQEVDFDDDRSICDFRPGEGKPFLITRGVQDEFGISLPSECLSRLMAMASLHDGIDYLQVFEIPELDQKIWLIDDGDGGAITALLPSEY